MPFQPMQQQPVNGDAGQQQDNGMPPAEQAEELFKQQFHQSAYSVLFSKFSDLAPSVVTFKIMHTSPEDGDGVGAFVIMYNNKPLYIPVVMTDGQLKPMDIVYFKELNMFLPLEKAWLDEISNMSLSSMGEDVEIPQDVPRDMDVRPLVYPPITPGGRIGYASDMEHDILKMFKESEDHYTKPQHNFLKIMASAPKYLLDGVKIAFERRPELLKKFVRNYGIENLTGAMSVGYSKIAKERVKSAGVFQVFTKNTPTQTLKDVYGSKAGETFSHIIKHGFIVQDTRPGITKIAVKVEGSLRLEEPGSEGGWFKLYFIDGPAANYFVIPWPNKFKSISRYSSTMTPPGAARPTAEYLCIREDGDEAFVEKGVIGERLYDTAPVENSKIYKILAGTAEGTKPTPDSFGFFIHSSQKNIEATEPEKIRFVITDGDQTRYVVQYGPTYIIDDDPTRQYFESQANGDIICLPKSTQWVELVSKVTDENDPECCGSEAYYRQRKNSIIKDPKLITRWLNSKLQKSEAAPVKVKSAGLNQWWVEGSDKALFLHEALAKVACQYGINAKDAGGILVDAQENGISSTWILDKRAQMKIAAEIYKMAQPPVPQEMQQAQQGPMPVGQYSDPTAQQGPPPGGPQDPSMQQMPQGMDPSMQQMPPMQPQINPTDLAIGEAVQQLTQQSEMQMQQLQSQMEQSQQAMQMQQQSTQQLIQVLQGIQQRSTQIAQGTQGAPIPPTALQSPSVAAGMIAPQQPEEEPPPPMPVMEGDTPDPNTIDQEINPEMIDQADALQDEGVFDTAALSMLSSAPGLQDIVASYVPNMEKCIDNLGRVLLTLWLTEGDTRKSLGDETYVMLEDKLRTVFKGLGDAVLSISHNALASSSGDMRDQHISTTMQ